MIKRVAFLSLHTSPLVQPGAGDGGGMNVYIDEIARVLVDRGVHVDVFTRMDGSYLSDVVVVPGYRVVHIPAGPSVRMALADLPAWVQTFADAVINRMRGEPYDVVHSHYWLSGWAGLLVKRALGLPLANSFHTLGRVKDATRRAGEPAESLVRIAAEQDVIDGSDCVIASTPSEAQDLANHYHADPARLCITHPGVNHDIFRPGSREEARRKLGWTDDPVVLVVGRIQALKGVDIAVEAFARISEAMSTARLVVVGGASGPSGDEELESLRRRVDELRLTDLVDFVPVRPHEEITDYYRASDLLLVPSRSETFGLVAAEAQACGLPVVATRVGGLAHAVEHLASGFLIEGWDPREFADSALRLLSDPPLWITMSKGAVESARRFSWEVAADRLIELYTGITEAV
jgi:D-inositol-3-phosphate glycosyltransferase